MTQEQLEAAAAAASLDQAHSNLTQRFTAETAAVMQLKTAYEQAGAAGARFAMLNPGMMMPGARVAKFAAGGPVGGSGNGDTVPAMLTPGEFVVNKKATSQNMGLLHAINDGKSVGFGKGGTVQYFEEGGRVLPGRTAATGAETRAIPLPRNAVQIGRGANVGLGFAAAQTAISQMTGRLVGFTKQVTDSFSQGARAAKQANKEYGFWSTRRKSAGATT
jgi:hypothetical protein